MSWAARRRFIILLIIGAIVVAFMTVVGIATFYQAPSCTDGRQNQNETGIDCGGPCPYRCTAEEQEPTVLFTKAIQNGAGRVDIAASVVNNNADVAAKNIPYSISVYGADQAVIQRMSGILDLPAGATVPVFVPGINVGKQKVANVFLEIASTSLQWYSFTNDPRALPSISNTVLGGTVSAPRVTAVLSNQNVTPLLDVHVIIFVRDMHGDVIGASGTVIPSISGHGQANAIFTWNNPFSGTPTSLEVMPIIELP